MTSKNSKILTEDSNVISIIQEAANLPIEDR